MAAPPVILASSATRVVTFISRGPLSRFFRPKRMLPLHGPAPLAFRPRRVRLKRRVPFRLKARRYPLVAPALVLFKPLRRLKIRRRTIRPLWLRRYYPGLAALVGFAIARPIYVARTRPRSRRRQVYPAFSAPVGFVAARKRPRLRLHSRPLPRFFRPKHSAAFAAALLLFKPVRRLRLRKRAMVRAKARRYPAMAPPVGFFPTKRPLRLKIKRKGRRPVWLRRFYPAMLAPVGFVARPLQRRLRLHSRPAARFFRPRHNPALAAALVLFRQVRRLRLRKRAVLRLRPRRYPIIPALVLFRPLRRLRLRKRVALRLQARRYPVMLAPVGFVPTKRMLRPRIKRARHRTRPRIYSLGLLPSGLTWQRRRPLRLRRGPHAVRRRFITPAALLLLFQRPPRMRLKRRIFARRLRRYPQFAAPAGAIQFKRPIRPRIARLRKHTIKAARIIGFFRLLLPDPRFGSLARNRRFGSAVGARNFGSIARWPVPQVHDFSLMDVGETVNGWIDFAQWLAPGETIQTVVSVTVANYYPPTSTPAYAQLTGSYQIGTVPIAEGGSGVTNAAVLQQWTGLNPGTARITIAITTTADQALSGWGHQPVGTPN